MFQPDPVAMLVGAVLVLAVVVVLVTATAVRRRGEPRLPVREPATGRTGTRRFPG